MSKVLLDYNDSDGENTVYGFRMFGWLIVASFDPFNGQYIKSSFMSDYVGVLHSEFSGRERGNKNAIKKRIFERYQEWQDCHDAIMNVCPPLHNIIIGDDAGSTRAAYIPQIRAYVIYKRYANRDLGDYTGGDFDVMQYCPFCGAQLPSTLENELTDILQKEYGLSSWEDYKKAPQEFHTDEWWKKRGL